MSDDTKKFLIKAALGLAFATMIGYVIKLEKKIEDGIDEHYDSKAS